MRFLNKLFKAKEPIIIVSGLPRSGTSMMMKMLEAGGIPPLTDKIRTPDEDNPQGYYEFERVKKLDKGDTAWLAEAQGRVVKVISQLLKNLPPDYEYKVIFMQRNMAEILASQKKMLINRGENPESISDEELAQLFEKHLNQVLRWLEQQPNFTTLFIHYHDTLTDPQTQAEKVRDFLARELDVAGMTAVVNPLLYRNRQEQPNQTV